VNLLVFVIASIITIPICFIFSNLALLSFTQHPDTASLIAAITLEVSAGLTAIVVLLHFLTRAVIHPLRHQVCPECRSDVAATATLCRYCRTSLCDDSADDSD
jgi:ribosomal protein L40E